MLAFFAEQPWLADEGSVLQADDRFRIGDAKRREVIEVGEEFDVELGDGGLAIEFGMLGEAAHRDAVGDVALEGLDECGDLRAGDRQAGGHRVATAFDQMRAAGVDRFAQVDLRNRTQAALAQGWPRRAVGGGGLGTVERDDAGWLTKGFDQATGDDADDSLVPAFAGEHQRGAGFVERIRLGFGDQVRGENLRQATAFIIFSNDAFEGFVGLGQVLGSKQSDVGHRGADPTGGI